MKTVDFVKMSLEMSQGWIMGLATDMKDAPFARPTPNGGNHPLWNLGHLVYSEANLLHEFILGDENPIADWKEKFGQGCAEPTDNPADYPTYDEVLAKFEEVRASTMAALENMTDEDFDKDSHAPEEMKEFFGKISQCFAAMCMHFTFHGGQIADARRAAGRAVLMG